MVPCVTEAVEASLCYFFENWLMKLKCPNHVGINRYPHQKGFFSCPQRFSTVRNSLQLLSLGFT